MVAPVIIYGIVSGVILAIEAIKPRVRRWRDRKLEWRAINSGQLLHYPHKVDVSRTYSTDKESEAWALVTGTTMIGATEEEYEEVNVVVPSEFICPISMEPMKDPVILVKTKQTYDRESIEKWLLTSSRCPCTGISLTDAPESSSGKGKPAVESIEEASILLESNIELRTAINKWRSSVPTPKSLQNSELIL